MILRLFGPSLFLLVFLLSTNVGAVVLFSDDFSTAKGWTGYETNYWERGSATAGGGGTDGNPDPSVDNTPTGDNFIIGVKIGGDAPNADNGPHYLTSPVIDCSGETNVQISFYRWLNSWGWTQEDNDLEVFDGSQWRRIYTSLFTEDDEWVQHTYDVSLYAANNASFQVRFKFEYISTVFPEDWSSWNVDDLEVSTFTGEVNQFVDGDFEADVGDWVLNAAGTNLFGYRHDRPISSGAFVTSGEAGMYLYSFNNLVISIGESRGYEQTLDLTDVASIVFDAKHRNGTHIAARALIDGVEKWRKDIPGTYLDQAINVSGMTGNHTFQLQLLVTSTAVNVPSEWVQFDNVRTVAVWPFWDIYVDFGGVNGDGSNGSPFNNMASALAFASDTATIHIDSGSKVETFTDGSAIGADGKALTLVNETPGSGSVFIGAAARSSSPNSRSGFISRGTR